VVVFNGHAIFENDPKQAFSTHIFIIPVGGDVRRL
jgi:hypothetical protein